MLTKLVVIIVLVSACTSFQLAPKRTHVNGIRPVFQRSVPLPMAVKPSAVTASPNVFKQLISASLKQKVIVGAHAIAVVAFIWMLKAIMLFLQTKLLKKKQVKRFYGISKPIQSYAPKVVQKLQSSDVSQKKRRTIASVVSATSSLSSTSLQQAKAQVVSILESLDNATMSAKKRVEQSFSTIVSPKKEMITMTRAVVETKAPPTKRFYGISRPIRYKVVEEEKRIETQTLEENNKLLLNAAASNVVTMNSENLIGWNPTKMLKK